MAGLFRAPHWVWSGEDGKVKKKKKLWARQEFVQFDRGYFCTFFGKVKNFKNRHKRISGIR